MKTWTSLAMGMDLTGAADKMKGDRYAKDSAEYAKAAAEYAKAAARWRDVQRDRALRDADMSNLKACERCGDSVHTVTSRAPRGRSARFWFTRAEYPTVKLTGDYTTHLCLGCTNDWAKHCRVNLAEDEGGLWSQHRRALAGEKALTTCFSGTGSDSVEHVAGLLVTNDIEQERVLMLLHEEATRWIADSDKVRRLRAREEALQSLGAKRTTMRVDIPLDDIVGDIVGPKDPE